MATRWKTLAGRGAPEEAWARFDELLDEYAFNYALKAVAGDPNHPVVLGMLYCPPHEWLGMSVPGSRGSGGDGPDQHYVLIPVTHGAGYQIEGRRFEPEPADIPLTVTGNPSLTMTLGSLDLRRIEVADDGRYTLTAGPEPPGDNPNHVQVPPGAMYIFIRECRSDWRQVPSSLRVRRIDSAPVGPWTDEETAARAAGLMVEDVPPIFWFMSLLGAMEPNTVAAPVNTGGVGGLVSQSIMFARLELDDDDAFVFTIGPGGAPYRGIAFYDYWFRTIEYWRRQSTLNLAQSEPNPDGTITLRRFASGSRCRKLARSRGAPASARPAPLAGHAGRTRAGRAALVGRSSGEVRRARLRAARRDSAPQRRRAKSAPRGSACDIPAALPDRLNRTTRLNEERR